MKLNFLFIVMDLLTLLAYPMVFAYGKVRRFLISNDGVSLVSLIVAGSVAADR